MNNKLLIEVLKPLLKLRNSGSYGYCGDRHAELVLERLNELGLAITTKPRLYQTNPEGNTERSK